MRHRVPCHNNPEARHHQAHHHDRLLSPVASSSSSISGAASDGPTRSLRGHDHRTGPLVVLGLMHLHLEACLRVQHQLCLLSLLLLPPAVTGRHDRHCPPKRAKINAPSVSNHRTQLIGDPVLWSMVRQLVSPTMLILDAHDAHGGALVVREREHGHLGSGHLHGYNAARL